MVGLGKPKLCTKSEVPSFSHCVNIEVEPQNFLPLLSARPQFTFPAKERHHPSNGTNLHCLVTEAQRYELFAKGCYTALPQWGTEQPIVRKSWPYRYTTATPLMDYTVTKNQLFKPCRPN